MMKLEEFAEINMGQSPESSSYNENKDGLPFFQGKADFGKVSPEAKIWCNKPAKIAEKYDILMSVRAPVGDLNIANEKCCIGRGLAGIRANGDKCYYKYLYYFLKSKYRELNQMATGSTFKAISKNNILTIEGNIPEITEQKIIVDKLDKIQNLIDLEEKQIEDSNELIKSQFVEMFESKDYNKTTIGKCAKFQGGYAFKSKDFVENGVKLVQISNVNKDTLDWIEINRVPESFIERYKEYSLVANDVVMAMTRPIIKSLNEVKIAQVREDDLPCLLNQRVGRFIINDSVNKEYLIYCCKSDKFKNYVEKMSGNSLQPNISSKQVENFEISLPPIELQNKFAEFVKQIDKQKLEIKKNIDELKKLQENLMNKYFN